MKQAIFLLPLLLGAAPVPPQENPVSALIDGYFESRWNEQGVKPGASADDYEFLRRATMDVLGRLPKADEIRAYVADPSKGKRAAIVDHLLTDPEAGRFFADRWMRLLFNYRFEETDPGKVDFPRFMAWLEKTFADDVPYDKFSMALIGAQGEIDETPEANFALRYLDPKEPPINLANRTTRVFLGLQMQCAQCHDHPDQPITQDEFWGTTAYFGGLRRVQRKTFEGMKTKLAQQGPAVVKMVISDVEKPTEVAAKFFDGTVPAEGQIPVQVLAQRIVSFKDDRFAKAAVNRIWGSLMGRGFVEPLDGFSEKNKPIHPALLDKLAADFRSNGFSLRRLERGILLSKVYGLASKRGEAPESEFTFKLLKPQDPPQFLNNFVWTLNLDSFFKDFYDKFMGNKDLPESYRNPAVFRIYLTTFVQKLLAPGGRAPEEMAYAGSVQLALKLMNSHDLQGLIRAGWGRLAEILKAESKPEGRIDLIYLTLLSRPPTADEKSRSLAYSKMKGDGEGPLEDLYWALINSTEFFFNH